MSMVIATMHDDGAEKACLSDQKWLPKSQLISNLIVRLTRKKRARAANPLPFPSMRLRTLSSDPSLPAFPSIEAIISGCRGFEGSALRVRGLDTQTAVWPPSTGTTAPVM